MDVYSSNYYNSKAIYSDCHTYRYYLKRDFGKDIGTCNFIMLNPSTATEEKNDPTVARCCSYAKNWGYRTLIITNIFPLRSTDPKGLYTHSFDNEVLNTNNKFIVDVACQSDIVITAWGNHGTLTNIGQNILSILLEKCPEKVYNLGVTKLGQPKHPLYLRKDLKPRKSSTSKDVKKMD